MIRKTTTFKHKISKKGIYTYYKKYYVHTYWILFIPMFSYEEILDYHIK